MNSTESCRQSVLSKLAGSKSTKKVGRVTHEIEGKRYHIKVKSGSLGKYPFNINPTVLAADYEVYVCGTDQLYYVLPMGEIEKMHADGNAMPDNAYSGYTILDVYPANNRIIYGIGGKELDIAKYRNLTL
jgi:hypothetical protein